MTTSRRPPPGCILPWRHRTPRSRVVYGCSACCSCRASRCCLWHKSPHPPAAARHRVLDAPRHPLPALTRRCTERCSRRSPSTRCAREAHRPPPSPSSLRCVRTAPPPARCTARCIMAQCSAADFDWDVSVRLSGFFEKSRFFGDMSAASNTCWMSAIDEDCSYEIDFVRYSMQKRREGHVLRVALLSISAVTRRQTRIPPRRNSAVRRQANYQGRCAAAVIA